MPDFLVRKMPAEMKDRLRELSEGTGAPMTWHVLRAIEEYLDAHQGPRDREQPERGSKALRAVQPASRASADGPPVGVEPPAPEPAAPAVATRHKLPKVPASKEVIADAKRVQAMNRSCDHPKSAESKSALMTICDIGKGGCGKRVR